MHQDTNVSILAKFFSEKKHSRRRSSQSCPNGVPKTSTRKGSPGGTSLLKTDHFLRDHFRVLPRRETLSFPLAPNISKISTAKGLRRDTWIDSKVAARSRNFLRTSASTNGAHACSHTTRGQHMQRIRGQAPSKPASTMPLHSVAQMGTGNRRVVRTSLELPNARPQTKNNLALPRRSRGAVDSGRGKYAGRRIEVRIQHQCFTRHFGGFRGITCSKVETRLNDEAMRFSEACGGLIDRSKTTWYPPKHHIIRSEFHKFIFLTVK